MTKKISADEIADLASKGEDITGFMSNMKKGFNEDRINKVRRTSLDLGSDLMMDLDMISNELNVSRQALIKVIMNEYVIRYKLSKTT